MTIPKAWPALASALNAQLGADVIQLDCARVKDILYLFRIVEPHAQEARVRACWRVVTNVMHGHGRPAAFEDDYVTDLDLLHWFLLLH